MIKYGWKLLLLIHKQIKNSCLGMFRIFHHIITLSPIWKSFCYLHSQFIDLFTYFVNLSLLDLRKLFFIIIIIQFQLFKIFFIIIETYLRVILMSYEYYIYSDQILTFVCFVCMFIAWNCVELKFVKNKQLTILRI